MSDLPGTAEEDAEPFQQSRGQRSQVPTGHAAELGHERIGQMLGHSSPSTPSLQLGSTGGQQRGTFGKPEDDDGLQSDVMKGVNTAITERLDDEKKHSLAKPSESPSSLLDKQEVTDDVIEAYRPKFPLELGIDHYDAMILYHESDKKQAQQFVDRVVEEVRLLKDQHEPKMVLYDEVHSQAGKSQIGQLDDMLGHCTYVLLYVTKHFVKDSFTEFSSQTALMDAIQTTEKRWSVVPIFTESKRSPSYKIPPSVRSLKGIQHLDHKFSSKDAVKKLLEERVHARFNRQKEQRTERVCWILKQQRREKEEEEERRQKEQLTKREEETRQRQREMLMAAKDEQHCQILNEGERQFKANLEQLKIEDLSESRKQLGWSATDNPKFKEYMETLLNQSSLVGAGMPSKSYASVGQQNTSPPWHPSHSHYSWAAPLDSNCGPRPPQIHTSPSLPLLNPGSHQRADFDPREVGDKMHRSMTHNMQPERTGYFPSSYFPPGYNPSETAGDSLGKSSASMGTMSLQMLHHELAKYGAQGGGVHSLPVTVGGEHSLHYQASGDVNRSESSLTLKDSGAVASTSVLSQRTVTPGGGAIEREVRPVMSALSADLAKEGHRVNVSVLSPPSGATVDNSYRENDEGTGSMPDHAGLRQNPDGDLEVDKPPESIHQTGASRPEMFKTQHPGHPPLSAVMAEQVATAYGPGHQSSRSRGGAQHQHAGYPLGQPQFHEGGGPPYYVPAASEHMRYNEAGFQVGRSPQDGNFYGYLPGNPQYPAGPNTGMPDPRGSPHQWYNPGVEGGGYFNRGQYYEQYPPSATGQPQYYNPRQPPVWPSYGPAVAAQSPRHPSPMYYCPPPQMYVENSVPVVQQQQVPVNPHRSEAVFHHHYYHHEGSSQPTPTTTINYIKSAENVMVGQEISVSHQRNKTVQAATGSDDSISGSLPQEFRVFEPTTPESVVGSSGGHLSHVGSQGEMVVSGQLDSHAPSQLTDTVTADRIGSRQSSVSSGCQSGNLEEQAHGDLPTSFEQPHNAPSPPPTIFPALDNVQRWPQDYDRQQDTVLKRFSAGPPSVPQGGADNDPETDLKKLD